MAFSALREGKAMKLKKLTAIPAIAIAAGIGLAACGSNSASTATPVAASSSAPAATHSAKAAAAPAAAKPAAPQDAVHTFSGSGTWNSPAFNIPDDVSSVKVVYSYWNNISAGETTGDNFIADIESSSDSQPIANTIATSGGATTTLYPNPSGDNSYHLAVTATGPFTFKITVTPAS